MWDEISPFSLSEIYDLYCYCVVCWPTRGKTDADGNFPFADIARAHELLFDFCRRFSYGIFDFPICFLSDSKHKLENFAMLWEIHSNIVENSRQNEEKSFSLRQNSKIAATHRVYRVYVVSTSTRTFAVSLRFEISHCCYADGLSMNNLCISFSSMQKLQLNYPNILLCFLASLSLSREIIEIRFIFRPPPAT